MKSEFYKLKHTRLPWLHLVLPLLYSLLFYLAVRYTGLKNFTPDDITESYYLLWGGLLPMAIATVTAMSCELDAAAANYQILLSSTPKRSTAYLAKLFALFTGALFAISSSVLLFALLYKNQIFTARIMAALLLLIAAFPLYMIHLAISIMVSSEFSLWLGFFESIPAFLARTNLFDEIWYYLPCTWPARLSASYNFAVSIADKTFLNYELRKYLYISIPISILILTASLICFKRLNGRILYQR